MRAVHRPAADLPTVNRRACLGLLGGAFIAAPARAAGEARERATAASEPALTAAPTRVAELHRQQPRQQKIGTRATMYYSAAWGVEKLNVRYTASGNLIRFSYRVADAERAKVLSAKATEPLLIGQRNNVVLHVPVMDKVGTLRQTATPQLGQEYWMVFSNKGNFVRQGDRVNVDIGAFHADGLMVE